MHWSDCAEGNKEEYQEGEYNPSTKPPSGSPYEDAQKNRRFQVYVHSKLMIVDDEVCASSHIQLAIQGRALTCNSLLKAELSHTTRYSRPTTESLLRKADA